MIISVKASLSPAVPCAGAEVAEVDWLAGVVLVTVVVVDSSVGLVVVVREGSSGTTLWGTHTPR